MEKQLPLIIRAIITGFGYKLGSELGKFVVDKVKARRKPEPESEEETQDDLPEGLPKDPANPGADKDARPSRLAASDSPA